MSANCKTKHYYFGMQTKALWPDDPFLHIYIIIYLHILMPIYNYLTRFKVPSVKFQSLAYRLHLIWILCLCGYSKFQLLDRKVSLKPLRASKPSMYHSRCLPSVQNPVCQMTHAKASTPVMMNVPLSLVPPSTTFHLFS